MHQRVRRIHQRVAPLLSTDWLLLTVLFHPMQGLVRVYTKKVGHKPDFGDPVVLR